MSKTLPASCVAGVVLAGLPPLPVPTATILSEGIGASTGVVVLDEFGATYVAKTSPDLKTTLEQLIDVLTQVTDALNKTASALTLVDAKPTGGAGSAVVPTTVSDVAGITAASAAIVAIKTVLTTFKAVLK